MTEEKKKTTVVSTELKKITGLVYARIVGLNNREKFYIQKKYKNQKKTQTEWKKQLEKDGLIIRK